MLRPTSNFFDRFDTTKTLKNVIFFCEGHSGYVRAKATSSSLESFQKIVEGMGITKEIRRCVGKLPTNSVRIIERYVSVLRILRFYLRSPPYSLATLAKNPL